ncbi:MAG: hypothetical protein HZC18_09025 [Candidatus Omnitrophica bacterium]|nr:hypothetical protein [Candidatus Omnitrophota bacterium]
MPLMNSATGFRAHRMLEVVVKGITLYNYCKDIKYWLLQKKRYLIKMLNKKIIHIFLPYFLLLMMCT